MKIIKIMKIVGTVCLIVLAMILLLVWLFLPHRPSDDVLKQHFVEERATLEQLKDMMEEDWMMSSIAPSFLHRQDTLAWPRPESEWGITQQRWDQYKRLFRKAGIGNGITRREKSSDILLAVWDWGIVAHGISISYIYCGGPRHEYAHTEPPCIEHKDTGIGQEDGDRYRYEKIDQDWYLYEEDD